MKKSTRVWFKFRTAAIFRTLTNLTTRRPANITNGPRCMPVLPKKLVRKVSEIASQFEGVAAVEKGHEERYTKPIDNMMNKRVFSRDMRSGGA